MTPTERKATIIGVGAVGCRLAKGIRTKLPHLTFRFVDTDRYALMAFPEEERLLIGSSETEGRGTGKRPEIGRRAAEEAEEEIKNFIGEADVTMITASFGGGTGAGAAPRVARFARESSGTTIVAAVDPFAFESSAKVEQACEALLLAGDQAEAIVRIPCTLLPGEGAGDPSFSEALLAAETHATEAVIALTQMVMNPGMLRLDFGDLRRVLCEPGGAVIGTGRAGGDRRIENAIRQACNSSFLDAYRIHAAANIVLHVAGGEMLSLSEVQDGARAINGISQGDYMLSVDVRPELSDEVTATVLLSGFSADSDDAQARPVQDNAAPPGAFVYEGTNIDVPTFLRRSRNKRPARGRSSSAYRFGG
ncbi:MAG: hypothetical protein HQ592_13625 [Planctomycetes bacterium]|nr:hypothetical protein [Planctomycetota bacterium]